MLDTTPDTSKSQATAIEARYALATLAIEPSRPAIERAIVAAHDCLTLDGVAGETGEPELLGLCHDLAESLSRVHFTLSPAVWLQLRGVARLRLYELQGGLSTLIAGVADLRDAIAGLPESDKESRAYVTGELAVALTRLGEQTSDLAPLHEALRHLDAQQPYDLADCRMANARAVAMMRIGAMAGDSSLVEMAARDLQAFVRGFSPTGDIARMCERNIVAILLENARQERNERVYRDLIRILEPRMPADLQSRADGHLAQFLSSAFLELARIELEADLASVANAQSAVALLERLVSAAQGSRRTHLEALHQLGQARFLLGFATGVQALVEGALEALRAALALCEGDRHLPDGRRPRLLSDLANYTLAGGRRFKLAGAEDEAERLFTAAMSELAVERAPGLFVQMASGLFDLLYRTQRWEQAVQVAERIDAALTLVESDPRLSAGVRVQGARLRSAITAKHVTALSMLGRRLEAAIVIERTRGRRIALTADSIAEIRTPTPEPAPTAIAAAEAVLKAALAGADDTVCRLAWERLAHARRRAGLDLGSREDALAALRGAAPRNGAFVQIHFSEHCSLAFLWTHENDSPSLIHLPVSAFAAVQAIFHGPSPWIATYEQAIGATGATRPSEADITEWSHTIAHCLQVLGEQLFEALEKAFSAAGIDDGASVYLCPPGYLALLPIAAARLPAGDHAGDRWSVSVVPNAHVLSGSIRPVTSAICVGGWTDGSDGNSALPMALIEATLLPARFGGMTALGTDVSPAGLIAAMEAVSLVHVACHGTYDTEVPARSGLELPNARLTLMRLASSAFQQMPTRLVYLSCCEAGMTGRTRDYDEFVGLPAGFLQLGVQGVIASLWAVEDIAAMIFAFAFYDRWASTSAMPPALALGRTQQWLRTATWKDIEEAGYLPGAIGERIRQGQFRSALRRVEEAPDPALPIICKTEQAPFAAPEHWAGWVLFGR